jgi:hypothetical protein
MKRIICLAVCISLVLLFVPSDIVLATSATTSITITKYGTDNTTLAQQTVTWEWMSTNLAVQGDGTTHYYFQGPTNDDSTEEAKWDPGETVNLRDWGAPKGTDIKDLCNLVGGASAGDTIKIKGVDNFKKWFDYEDVYTPELAQGKMIVAWYIAGNGDGSSGYVPNYDAGMRLFFLAQTTNSEGKHVFGNWDMHQTLAESRWYYYNDGENWPSSGGLSVKYISSIEIYASGQSTMTLDSLVATANVTLDSLGIRLNMDSIDFGNVKPGKSSTIKTIVITNTGTSNCDVSLEVQSDNGTAESFYQQSLYINNSLYDIDTIITSILSGNSVGVDTQLKVPDTWNEAGEQQATFIFWATASD